MPPRALVLAAALVAAGCLAPDSPAEIGLRIENRASGAVGLHVEFLEPLGNLVYEVDILIRHGEVGTHETPLPEGNYTVVVELTRGPGSNREADDNTLPPATQTSRVEAKLDGARCEGMALFEVRVTGEGELGTAEQTCLVP